MLGEGGVEEIDRRHVEHVEPDHRLLGRIAVIVRSPVRRDHEIAAAHDGLLALDRGVSAIAVEHETDRRSGVPVRGRDLARKDQLQTGIERLRDARAAGQGGVFEHEHAALSLLGGDQRTGFDHHLLHFGEAPQRRHARRLGLRRYQAFQHFPERRQILLADAVVIGSALGRDRAGDGLARLGHQPRRRAFHGALPIFLDSV